eukprot:12436314-Heterocapsa_arctica.AAC.1
MKYGVLGDTGPSGRPLVVAVDFLSKRKSFFTNYEPKGFNRSLKDVKQRKRIIRKRKRLTKTTQT